MSNESNEELAQLRAENERLRGRLSEIESAAKADEDDLAKMRDGTKLTRAGLVHVIAYWKEKSGSLTARVAELEAKPVDLQWKQDMFEFPAADLPFGAWLTITESKGKFRLRFQWSRLIGECATLDEAKEAANRYVADELKKFAALAD